MSYCSQARGSRPTDYYSLRKISAVISFVHWSPESPHCLTRTARCLVDTMAGVAPNARLQSGGKDVSYQSPLYGATISGLINNLQHNTVHHSLHAKTEPCEPSTFRLDMLSNNISCIKHALQISAVNMIQRRLRHEHYTVGWVCALPIELAAAQEMLDEKHHSLPVDSSDPNSYTLGRIGDHNVVISCLPASKTGA